MVPHCRAPVWETRATSRMCASIELEDPADCRIAILGMPDDTGVGLNGGRLGAAGGPAALRRAMERYGTRFPDRGDWARVFDAGDVSPGESLEETHERVVEAAGALHDLGLFPIGIGGGHDLTLPFVRAASERAEGAMAGVYFDAHLDVREKVGSGMPFRRLVEIGAARELHVHGLDAFSNSREHLDWFSEHGGRIERFAPEGRWPRGAMFVSLDLDVIDQAFAPGVSAMNPCGWSPAACERWVRAAARQDGLRCFDIMELNPAVDESGRTARLAARLLLAFIEELGRARGLVASEVGDG